ncbi:WG repeat-containing protein [Falsibacillus albus]|nr:WG repeat-containing protein [Falsibacillus albus]
MSMNEYLAENVKPFLPDGASLFWSDEGKNVEYIVRGDLDDDGEEEVAAAYLFQNTPHLMILKKVNDAWTRLQDIKGEGYSVSFLQSAKLTEAGGNQLLVGWQQGSMWSQLAILEWTGRAFEDKVKNEIVYSKIEVGDMPGEEGGDGQDEMALWLHDTGKAYRIEVYRWRKSRVIPAYDVYPYYFKKVEAYYQKLVRSEPLSSFYWYYLAEAQWNSQRYLEALQSICAALHLKNPYPSEGKLLQIKKEIEQAIQVRTDGLYPVPVKRVDGTKWGYIDEQGIMMLEPRYERAYAFQKNDRALIEMDDHFGVIDREGSYIVDPVYTAITEFSENRAAIVDRDGFQMIDENGTILTKRHYEYIGIMKNGRALAGGQQGGTTLYGYLNRSGKEAIALKFLSGTDFHEGVAVVKLKEDLFALINVNGEWLKTYPYHQVLSEHEDRLAFQKKEHGLYGFIDRENNVVIIPKFTGAQPFENDRAIVADDDRYGLIDREGDYIIPPAYSDIQSLGENRAAVGHLKDKQHPFIGSHFALADHEGNILTTFSFESILPYHNGLASAQDENQTFFIDLAGKKVEYLPVLDGAGTLTIDGKLIKADVDQRISYYDFNGKRVWRQNTIIPLNDQYRIIEKKFKPNRNYLVYYPKLEGIQPFSKQKEINLYLEKASKVKKVPKDKQLDYDYEGDFSVRFIKKELLVLELNGYEYYFGAAHGMPIKDNIHIDLQTGERYALKDLFKMDADHLKVLTEIITRQIRHDPQYDYVFPESFKGVTNEQPFYVDDNNLYLYFTPYDIAPYAAGFPTFKISFTEIDGVIDHEGGFWRSFH